jgi:hypothetical protein
MDVADFEQPGDLAVDGDQHRHRGGSVRGVDLRFELGLEDDNASASSFGLPARTTRPSTVACPPSAEAP